VKRQLLVKVRKLIERHIRHTDGGVSVAADIKAAIAANVAEKGAAMPENPTGVEYRALTPEELQELAGEELPERAAMSLINANLAIPINAAVAANVLSDGAVAWADATQDTPIDQSS
jgi:hypothetical protein